MKRVAGGWLESAGTQAVLAALESAGAQALIVGGCVRNALFDLPVSDVDIATDARPERVMDIAESAGMRVVPTGIEHGTVTIVVDGAPYEVTTFRRDIETDGRRAIVRFADTIEEDAARRDFTMNALYARRDGTVVDPLGGLADLEARRVRFIGDSGDRIREDYLRSLRYFRFHALYGDPEGGFDPEALAGIAEYLDGIDLLSRERVGAEMLKLLAAADPGPSVATMRQLGLLMRCLPGSEDAALAPLVHLEGDSGIAPSALRRLAVLGGEEPGTALRLSRQQQRSLQTLRRGMSNMQRPAELAYRFGAEAAMDILLLRAASTGGLLPSDHAAQIALGGAAICPVKAGDLSASYSGPALGARLRALEQAWIDSGFTLDRSALMAL